MANDSKNIVLDLDTNTTVVTNPVSQQNSRGATPDVTKRSAKDFSPEERKAIVDECTEKFVSPAVLAQKYNVNVTAIRDWVKNAGKKLPQKYTVTSTKDSKPNNSGQQQK